MSTRFEGGKKSGSSSSGAANPCWQAITVDRFPVIGVSVVAVAAIMSFLLLLRPRVSLRCVAAEHEDGQADTRSQQRRSRAVDAAAVAAAAA